MTIFEFLFVCFFSLEVSTMERKLTFQAKPWMRFWRVKFHKQNRISPLHTSLQVVSFQRCPVCRLVHCTTVLLKVLSCKIKYVLLILIYLFIFFNVLFV